MNCSQHPDRITEIVCNSCKVPLCEECRYSLGEQSYCRRCLEQVLKKDTVDNDNIRQYETREMPAARRVSVGSEKKSRFWTFLLSLIPGVGYLYLGLMKRGLQAMVVFFGTIFVGNMIGLESIIALILPVVMFYTIFDSQQIVRKMNTGEEVLDKELFSIDWIKIEHRWIGYGLIALGVLALVNNVLPMLFSTYVFRAVLGPMLIIAAGVFILYRNMKN